LGYAYSRSNILARLVQPVIEAASEHMGESMAVAVLDENWATVIARTSVRRSLSSGVAVGMQLPVYCSAIGRVLLAALPPKKCEAILKQCHPVRLTPRTKTHIPEIIAEVRKSRDQGYAINDQEVEIGLRTIAVPVLDGNGKVHAGMSVSAAASRADAKALVSRLLPELDAARRKLASIIHAG
jgi:IclR family pca regulon transcriptional regulator